VLQRRVRLRVKVVREVWHGSEWLASPSVGASARFRLRRSSDKSSGIRVAAAVTRGGCSVENYEAVVVVARGAEPRS